jgi:hypothetical protein
VDVSGLPVFQPQPSKLGLKKRIGDKALIEGLPQKELFPAPIWSLEGEANSDTNG